MVGKPVGKILSRPIIFICPNFPGRSGYRFNLPDLFRHTAAFDFGDRKVFCLVFISIEDNEVDDTVFRCPEIMSIFNLKDGIGQAFYFKDDGKGFSVKVHGTSVVLKRMELWKISVGRQEILIAVTGPGIIGNFRVVIHDIIFMRLGFPEFPAGWSHVSHVILKGIVTRIFKNIAVPILPILIRIGEASFVIIGGQNFKGHAVGVVQ